MQRPPEGGPAPKRRSTWGGTPKEYRVSTPYSSPFRDNSVNLVPKIPAYAVIRPPRSQRSRPARTWAGRTRHRRDGAPRTAPRSPAPCARCCDAPGCMGSRLSRYPPARMVHYPNPHPMAARPRRHGHPGRSVRVATRPTRIASWPGTGHTPINSIHRGSVQGGAQPFSLLCRAGAARSGAYRCRSW